MSESVLSPKLKPGRRYAVFLSYRHADNKEQGRQWATWLHQALEGYEVPVDLVGARNMRGDLIPTSLYPVFRDEEELPADADLTRNIRHALENSELLVVLCSPRAVESRFVAEEIRYFKELGKSDRILALMIDGEPNAASDPGKIKAGVRPEAECLPEPLRYGVEVADTNGTIDWSQRTEPIAADARPDGKPEQGWTTGAAYRDFLHKQGDLPEKALSQKVRDYERQLELAKLKVVAGALSVPLGELTRRDKAMQLGRARQRARTLKLWLGAVALLALLALAAAIYAGLQRQEAVSQRRVAEAQRREAQETASTTDFAIADLKLQSDDVPEALAYLASSLRNNPANITAVSRLVSLLRAQSFCVSKSFEEGILSNATFSPDGKWVAASGKNGVRLWDAATGKLVGPAMRHENDQNVPNFINSIRFSPDGKQLVTASWDQTARVWDTRTGLAIGEPKRHEDNVNAARFSPDGKLIVTASDDKTARIWNTGSNVALQKMMHSGAVKDASFSPDGKWIVTAAESNTAQVWNAQTGGASGQPMTHEDKVNCATFSPDGNWIATASVDKTARVWDARTGKPISKPMIHINSVTTAEFSPDGQRLLTVSWDKTRVWDAATGEPLGESIESKNAVTAASFSPDGRWILIASLTAARLYDAETGTPVSEPMRHEAEVTSARFSPDGTRVVTASYDGTIRVWKVQSTRPVPLRVHPGGSVFVAEFSPDGAYVVTSSEDKSPRVWDSRTGRAVGRPIPQVGIAKVSPNGKWIVTASPDNTAQIWDVQTGNPVGEPMRHQDKVFSAEFSPDGKFVVTASLDKTARVWEAGTSKPIGEPLRHENTVETASFSPNNNRIVTASADGTARVWEAQTGKPISEPMRHQEIVNHVTFSPGGEYVLTTTRNAARIWNARTGALLRDPMRLGTDIHSASFSPDGRWIAIASSVFGDDSANMAQVYETKSGHAVGAPMRHGKIIGQVVFSPDGKWVLTASADNTARMWEAQTGRAVTEAMSHDRVVWSANFSPDGRWIVTGSEDGTAGIWEAGIYNQQAPGWLLTLAEALAGKRLNANGVLEPCNIDLPQLHEQLRNLKGDDELSRFGRWYEAEASSRTISPLSSFTIPDAVSELLSENTADRDAYLIDPGNPVVLASLARFQPNKAAAAFLCREALARALANGNEALIAKVRDIVSKISAMPPDN